MRVMILVLPASLALAACDGGAPVAEPAAGEATPTEAGVAADDPVVGAAADGTAAALPGSLPQPFRGRWGLTAADCEPGRADAKGLLTITSDKLEFYESVGELDEVEQAAPDRIRASFDFTGEGMTWERDIEFVLEDAGATLIRREFGADAAPEPNRYTRCSQGN